MNVQLLIDSIVRQTTVLIAQLATAGGVRAPLAHVADQVFLELARELEAQGVSRKVSADMFGMALRTLPAQGPAPAREPHRRGRSLWEAVLGHISEPGCVTRGEVLERFRRDDQSVRGVLHDLAESGLVFASGSRGRHVYRVASAEELGQLRASAERGADALLWALIYREGPLTRAELRERVLARAAALDAALARLRRRRGHVERDEARARDAVPLERLIVEQGAAAGWEAAVYDHLQAVVKTVCARLDRDTAREGYREHIGGSTYSLDVGPEHPLRGEALATLERIRAQLGDLRRASTRTTRACRSAGSASAS